MKVNKLKTIADAIATGSQSATLAAIDAALEGETGAHWLRDLGKLREVIRDDAPRFTIHKKDGNSKLPFLAFSALPGEGFCPGAGDCLDWCYSFRAWRYPAAFARQAQNSWLLQSGAGRNHIVRALDDICADLEAGEAIDFRLYVDGGFRDTEELRWWLEALRARPWLRTYGYSKSWREFIALNASGYEWPSNYLLNLSGGSLHGDAVKERMKRLPITRGEFLAVPMGRKVRSSDHGDREHQKELRKAFGSKAFTCPGKCGECTPKGHACGSDRFRGIPVIIAVH
jgi:hypothetical protein